MYQSKSLIIIALLCLINFNSASGEARRALITDTVEKQIGQSVNPVVINDLIIYQVIENEVASLWSYSTQTAENSLIFTGELNSLTGIGTYIHSTDNFAYFVSGSDSEQKIWQSDGTAVGTRPVEMSNPAADNTYIRSRGNMMFTISGGGNLVSTNGSIVVEHDIVDPNLTFLCSFDVNDVITTRFNDNSNELEILRSKNGEVSVLSDSLENDFTIFYAEMFYLNDFCYVQLTGEEGVEILVVPQDGESRKLSQEIDLSRVFVIFPFENSIFAWLNSDSDNLSSISRFNQQLNDFDANFFAPTNSQITSYRQLPDHILVHTSNSGNPEIHFLNSNLIEDANLEGVDPRIPATVYPTLNKDLLAFFVVQSGFQETTLSFSVNPEESPAFISSDARLLHVITNDTSETVFLMLGDYISKGTTIYALTDTPDINQSLNGIWHDPNIKNQGIVITPGTRVNGSEYLFVTVYTFKNGEPLWLSGVGELQLGQNSIEVLLASYSGIETFEEGISPEQEIFGSINITMTGCNTMSTEITSNDDEVYALNLTRINNTDFSHLCID